MIRSSGEYWKGKCAVSNGGWVRGGGGRGRGSKLLPVTGYIKFPKRAYSAFLPQFTLLQYGDTPG